MSYGDCRERSRKMPLRNPLPVIALAPDVLAVAFTMWRSWANVGPMRVYLFAVAAIILVGMLATIGDRLRLIYIRTEREQALEERTNAQEREIEELQDEIRHLRLKGKQAGLGDLQGAFGGPYIVGLPRLDRDETNL